MSTSPATNWLKATSSPGWKTDDEGPALLACRRVIVAAFWRQPGRRHAFGRVAAGRNPAGYRGGKHVRGNRFRGAGCERGSRVGAALVYPAARNPPVRPRDIGKRARAVA